VELSELQLVTQVAEGSETAFEELFKTWFKSLHAYARVMLEDEMLAEEAVQQVFFRIWERKERFRVHTSVKAFLYRAVYNECMNYLKRQKYKTRHADHVMHSDKTKVNYENPLMRVERAELEVQLQKALNELPLQCRNIFYLSRFDELKYRQIAEQLGLSIKTVEAQMGKALKILRNKLADFLPLLVWLLLKLRNIG
jgi:RNA polymerase sigma-70 factor (ECF subfamily)